MNLYEEGFYTFFGSKSQNHLYDWFFSFFLPNETNLSFPARKETNFFLSFDFSYSFPSLWKSRLTFSRPRSRRNEIYDNGGHYNIESLMRFFEEKPRKVSRSHSYRARKWTEGENERRKRDFSVFVVSEGKKTKSSPGSMGMTTFAGNLLSLLIEKPKTFFANYFARGKFAFGNFAE